MNRDVIRRFVNMILVTVTFGSWFAVFFFGKGSLVQNGIGSLRYFTILSNLFVGIVAAIWLVGRRGGKESACEAARQDGGDDSLRGRDAAGAASNEPADAVAGGADAGGADAAAGGADAEGASAGGAGDESDGPRKDSGEGSCEGNARRIEVWKYVAAAAVSLTCLTVLGFLGPIYGYGEMLSGANFFMHLANPIIAVAEVIFLSDASFTRKDNRLVMIPPFIYGIGYLANILINGMGEWPDTHDWYFFFAWGYAVGALIYVVLLVVTWLAGLLMRKLHERIMGCK